MSKTATTRTRLARTTLTCALLAASGCGGAQEDPPAVASSETLLQRAYVVSELSDELFVVDLETLEEVGRVQTSVGDGINQNHMAVVSQDGAKVFITATAHDAIVVVDAAELTVSNVIPVGAHNTHANACFDCGPGGRDELWVVNEDDGSVSVIDMGTEVVVARVEHPSMVVPHTVSFAGGRAYVPSIGGNQISVVDMEDYEVTEVLLVDGVSEAGPCSADPCGFADAQIDGDGMLFAAHIQTGRVLVYDTTAHERVADIPMGFRPWSVFVDTLSNDYDTHLMPNWGDSTVSIMDRNLLEEVARSRAGDVESYGINYSPLAPGRAFVLNRSKHEVAVIDRVTGEGIEAIDVGGTTETASTTADGKYLLVPVSSKNELRVIDVETLEQVARFDGVGRYPWSVTTIGGQNYCH